MITVGEARGFVVDAGSAAGLRGMHAGGLPIIGESVAARVLDWSWTERLQVCPLRVAFRAQAGSSVG